MAETEFNNKYLTQEMLQQNQGYFAKSNPDSRISSLLITEVSGLYKQVSVFDDELVGKEAYQNLLYTLVRQLEPITEEAQLLEVLIPNWQFLRGNQISRDKAVDEFYFEFEMITLWVLLTDSITGGKFQPQVVSKMRAIIRRYSNLPNLWQFLCNYSGEEVKVGYTF